MVKVIFVAGPYSGDTAANIARITDLAVEVARLGCFPVCPNMLGVDPRFTEVQPYEFWIEATRAALARCDAIIFTPDYLGSSGARGEEIFARQRGLRCLYGPDELEAWLKVVDRPAIA